MDLPGLEHYIHPCKKLYLTVDMKNVMKELEQIENDVLYSQDKGLRQRIDALNKFLTDIEQKIDNATNECFSYIFTEQPLVI